MRCLPLLLVLPLAACNSVGPPPGRQAEWDQAEADLQDGDPSNDAAAEAKLDELEQEQRRQQWGPLAGVLPYGLGAIGLELLGLAASKRKRRLYGAAVKNLSSGQLASAAGDALKAWGVQHSQPQPPPPQPPSPA